jgi:hypothetical protein
VVFFYTFVLLASLCLLNIFVAVRCCRRHTQASRVTYLPWVVVMGTSTQVILDRMEEVAAVDLNPISSSDFCEKWAVIDPQVCPQQQQLPVTACAPLNGVTISTSVLLSTGDRTHSCL